MQCITIHLSSRLRYCRTSSKKTQFPLKFADEMNKTFLDIMQIYLVHKYNPFNRSFQKQIF